MEDVVLLGVNLTCALVALQSYEIPEKECLLMLFAKALGYAIIVASTILRLPQILLILRHKSVEGLAMASFEIECVGYTVAVSYCLYKQLPFSTYGELFFLLIQAYILMILIYYYSPKQGAMLWFKIGVYCAIAPVLLSGSLPGNVYETLYNGQTALFTLGRLPQLWTNYSNKNTGQLSFTSTFLSFAGCIGTKEILPCTEGTVTCGARLFTSIQEKAPISMVVGSVLGLISHGTLTFQIVIYSPPKFIQPFLPGKRQKTE